jgi:hypothetical protein
MSLQDRKYEPECPNERALRRVLIAAVFAFLGASGPAYGQFIVDHPPHPFGGPASDTEFIDMFSRPSWQLLADDFQIAAPAVARRLVWFGFYDRDNPPLTESMQIRLYDARPSDGLPGNVLHDFTIANPVRIATGRIIAVGISPREFRYEVELPAPLSLAAATPYWLSIVQLGDIANAWRWELSVADLDGHAFVNSSLTDWQHIGLNMPDLAFRLIVPEPVTFALVGVAVCPCRAARRRP